MESKANEDWLDDQGYDYAEPTYQQKRERDASIITGHMEVVWGSQWRAENSGEYEAVSYPDPAEGDKVKCNICGQTFTNFPATYRGLLGKDLDWDEGVKHLRGHVITESKANEDEYEYGFIPKVSGFGEDKRDKNLPIKDHKHNFSSGYQKDEINYVWQCSDSQCGATKTQDVYMESKANEDYGKPFNRNTDWEKLSKIVEGEWNNSTPEGRKKIIINTHNGFMSGHEPEILKQWADVEESTKHKQ